MHCVYLADIAAILSEHGPSIIYRGEKVPPDAMTRYWTISQNRFDLWNRALARYRDAEMSGDFKQLRTWWSDHSGVLEEILVSQMLTRVFAALTACIDAKQPEQELSPVAHSIFLAHLEATNRAQHLMLHGRGISVQDAVKLNRLRQGVERWNDAMLGRMCNQSSEVTRYAIDATRAKTYAEENRTYGHGKTRRTVSWLMNASMRDMLTRRTSKRPALPQANRAVAGSVVLLLRPDLFDSVGVLRSLYVNRIELDRERADCTDATLESAGVARSEISNDVDITNDCIFQRWYT